MVSIADTGDGSNDQTTDDGGEKVTYSDWGSLMDGIDAAAVVSKATGSLAADNTARINDLAKQVSAESSLLDDYLRKSVSEIERRQRETAAGSTMVAAMLGDDAGKVSKVTTPTESKLEADKKAAAKLAEQDAEERSKILSDAMTELNGLIGLDEVKAQVRENQATIQAALARKQLGLISSDDPEADDMNLHLVLTGRPGTGKTTVARIYAKILRGLGILKTGQLVETDRSGLVAGYQGQTAPQVNKVVDSALGGVLFIDEVYNLVNGTGKDDTFGNEAVATLMKRMEDDRDKFVVIVAGYTDLTERFLDANPGLRSRFVEKIEFPDYTDDELVEITEIKAKGKGIELTEENKKQLAGSYAKLRPLDAFANGRTARVLLDNSVKAQSIRFSRELAEHPDMSDEDRRSILTTLTAEDISKATEKTIEVSKSNESAESKTARELADLMKTTASSAGDGE